MKQNLLDYIKNKNNFRQILLNQDGGIMKYWAEHPDTDGRDALWKGYRNQCTKTFRDSNKWFMGEDSIKREALAYDHIKKELAYQVVLKHELSDFPEISEQADCFITYYLNYAFGEFQQNLHPNSYTSMEFYEIIISEFFAIGLGRPWRCLYLILDEYRGKAKKNKSVDDLWTEFEIRQYARKYYWDMAKGKLSQAVKEIIDEKIRSRNKEECRQICRKEAKEVMKKISPFVRMVNGDCDLVMYDGAIWSTKDLEYKGINVSKKIKKKDIFISKEEMVWLRGGMLYDGTKQTSLQDCFRRFYRVLEEIGNVWAVQLKEHGINIRELEKETGCVLNKKGFYVEHSLGGGFGKIIIIRDDDDGVEDKCNINNCELNSEKIVEKNCYNSNVFNNCQVSIYETADAPVENQNNKKFAGKQAKNYEPECNNEDSTMKDEDTKSDIPTGEEAEENYIIDKYNHFVETVKKYKFFECPKVACLDRKKKSQLIRKIVSRHDNYGAYAIAMLCELGYDKWMRNNFVKNNPYSNKLTKNAIFEHWKDALGLSNGRAVAGNYNVIRIPNGKENKTVYKASEYTNIVHDDYMAIKDNP